MQHYEQKTGMAEWGNTPGLPVMEQLYVAPIVHPPPLSSHVLAVMTLITSSCKHQLSNALNPKPFLNLGKAAASQLTDMIINGQWTCHPFSQVFNQKVSSTKRRTQV
jgi:hypothetical protein